MAQSSLRLDSHPTAVIRSATTVMLLRTIVTLSTFALLLSSLGCQKESESIVSIALHPTNANILYVATNDAVYKSRDGGGTWERFPSFSARRVTTLAIDPLLPATVYAGTMGMRSIRARTEANIGSHIMWD
jgi:hypothetical protein